MIFHGHETIILREYYQGFIRLCFENLCKTIGVGDSDNVVV